MTTTQEIRFELNPEVLPILGAQIDIMTEDGTIYTSMPFNIPLMKANIVRIKFWASSERSYKGDDELI